MKIALICSHGGHLTEMLYMIDAFKGHDVFFITYESSRTKNLDYKKYLFPNFGENPLVLLKNLLQIIKVLIKEKPAIMISNGAEIAIPFFYIGKLLRIKMAFIECYTRIKEPTITGKIVYPISDLFIVLWPEMLSKYGKKARFLGGLFKVDTTRYFKNDEKENMIFVTVGMHYQGFERLVKTMDEIAGKITEKVVIQTGNTQYMPKYAEYFSFKDYKDMLDITRRSKLVICQGAMSAIDSLVLGTPAIVIPRSKEYGEVINDHQLIFAKKLEELGLVKVTDDIDSLYFDICNLDFYNIKHFLVVDKDLVNSTKEILNNCNL